MHKTTKNFASQETFLFLILKKLAINVFSNTEPANIFGLKNKSL